MSFNFYNFSFTEQPTTPPSVFPLRQCSSGAGNSITLGCLAYGFYPEALTFQWTDSNGVGLTSLQYPPVLKNNTYTGVSLVQVMRSDWDSWKSFRCSVIHEGASQKVNLSSM